MKLSETQMRLVQASLAKVETISDKSDQLFNDLSGEI